MTAFIRSRVIGTGAVAVNTALTADAESNIVNMLVLFDAAPTTSEDLTLKLTSIADSAVYTLLTIDPSVTSATSLALTERWLIAAGDVLTVAYANTDTATYNVQITLGANGGRS